MYFTSLIIILSAYMSIPHENHTNRAEIDKDREGGQTLGTSLRHSDEEEALGKIGG